MATTEACPAGRGGLCGLCRHEPLALPHSRQPNRLRTEILDRESPLIVDVQTDSHGKLTFAGSVRLQIEDYEPYVPSLGAPSAFMASPIMDKGQVIGVLAFQLPADRINEVMTSKHAWKDVGLGQSGETSLVGAAT